MFIATKSFNNRKNWNTFQSRDLETNAQKRGSHKKNVLKTLRESDSHNQRHMEQRPVHFVY